MNKPLSTPTIMREVFSSLGIPADISSALIDAAKHSRNRSSTAETMAQMFVSVGRDLDVSGLKIVVLHGFEHPYLKSNYAFWTGIKASKAKKKLKNWAVS